MKNLLILGAGTGGTVMANRFAAALDRTEWRITIVDQDEIHCYQPGLLFIPFGGYRREDIVRPKRSFFPRRVRFLIGEIDRIEPARNTVLMRNGSYLTYDFLIIATGARISPGQIEGMKGNLWYKKVFDFYTLEGACALAQFLEHWKGGRMVVHIAEMPIKCPVAPLEFAFLADCHFNKMGIRDRVEIIFATPLAGAFTRAKASAFLGHLLSQKNIRLVADFNVARIDNEAQTVVSWDDIAIPFDLLVTVPTTMGDEALARSGLGDELNYVATDRKTLRVSGYDNIFAIGDATDLPVSKAGSVVHYQSDIPFENLLSVIHNRPLRREFDGHANCFIESGYGKAILLDFNYVTEPLPGTFPIPGIGPFSLLKESRTNHYGKMMFRWIYWNLLLRGRMMLVGSRMSIAGKKTEPAPENHFTDGDQHEHNNGGKTTA